MNKIKCKCGKEFWYSDGVERKTKKWRNLKPKCYDCEMKKYKKILENLQNS